MVKQTNRHPLDFDALLYGGMLRDYLQWSWKSSLLTLKNIHSILSLKSRIPKVCSPLFLVDKIRHFLVRFYFLVFQQ